MDKNAFLVEEYKALRAEIAFHASHSRVVESSIALGAAAIFAWAAKKATPELRGYIWWLPPVLALLGSIREYGNKVRSLQIADYIKKIEEYFLKEGTPEGWEQFLAEKRKCTRNHALGISSYAFWTLMLLSTVSVALFMSFS